MMRVAQVLAVQFHGVGHGAQRLSWGQQEIWQAMQRQRNWLPVGGALPLPAGRTVQDVADELRYMMSRFQVLRTRLQLEPACHPMQIVAESGEIPLEVVDADADADVSAVAEALFRQYLERDYDFVSEWPIRMAVVRQHGIARFQVVVSGHIVADAAGFAHLGREVTARVTTPVAGLQPLEQVSWQQSAAGQRQNELSLRYWERHLRTMPPRRQPESGEPSQPRHWQGEFTSLATFGAVQAIMKRTGFDSATVLLTAYALASWNTLGVNPVVTRSVVSNRFRPALSTVVCPLAQTGLCVMDVAHLSFDEALPVVQRASMTAYKHAYYDPAQLEELIAKIAGERGIDVDVYSFFNDRRDSTQREPTLGEPPTLDEIHAALPSSEFSWTLARDDPFEPLFVHFDDSRATTHITVHTDTRYTSLARAEALIIEIENVAVQAAYPKP
ncbi:MAG TPA: condensation domain-containing protein [Candidatus Limnocylindrales bacterium]|nr:condensation domain-containing protein [Candidatus Limnocylindrales bacterium]